jgi:hypothetical protein
MFVYTFDWSGGERFDHPAGLIQFKCNAVPVWMQTLLDMMVESQRWLLSHALSILNFVRIATDMDAASGEGLSFLRRNQIRYLAAGSYPTGQDVNSIVVLN